MTTAGPETGNIYLKFQLHDFVSFLLFIFCRLRFISEKQPVIFFF